MPAAPPDQRPVHPSIILSQPGTAPAGVAGAPRRYRKDAIRTGRFYVPNLDVWLDVTPERLDRWAANFAAMKDRGVPVDLTIDHKRGADSRRGAVVDLQRDGDELWFVTDAADDDAEALLQRCPHVSIEVDTDFKDGLGHTYDEAITAISVCRNPVVPGQQPFQRIAASRDRDRTADGPVLWAVRHQPDTPAGPAPKPPGADTMLTDEQIKQVRQTLKLSEEVKAQQVAERLLLALTEAEEHKARRTELDAEVTRLRDENAALKQKGEGLKLSADVQGVLEETVDAKLDLLKDKAIITPGQADALGKALKSGAVMLSREANGDAGKSRAMAILEAIGQGDPAELARLAGEKTGGQTRIDLATDRGGDDADLDELEKRTRDAEKRATGQAA